MKRRWIASLAISTMALAANAADITWDGSEGDGLWNTAANWTPAQVPGQDDKAIISNGNLVTHPSITMPTGMIIELSGGSDLKADGGAIRLAGSTWSVGAGSDLGGTAFWDLANASMTFEDGASISVGNWEQKGNNTFKFNLGASGFSPLTPGTLFLGGGATMANATYVADLANYTGSDGSVVLLDFNNAGITSADFATSTQTILNEGIYTNSAMRYDEIEKQIILDIIGSAADTNAPIITVLGPNPANTVLGRTYVDNGATAFDVVDGDLTDQIVVSGTVDINTLGTNTLTYSCVDAAGNTGTAVRTVFVITQPQSAWETDFLTNPTNDGFDVSGTYVLSNGIFAVTDTSGQVNTPNPTEPWEGITEVEARWRSTSDATAGFKGASVRISVAGNAPDYALIDVSSEFDGVDTQVVTIYEGNDVLVELPGPFGPDMLTLEAEIDAARKELVYMVTDGTISNSGMVAFSETIPAEYGTPGNGMLIAWNGSAEYDYFRIDTEVLPDATFVEALGSSIDLDVTVEAPVASGSVDVVYGSATNVNLTISYAGDAGFTVLTPTPQALPSVSAQLFALNVEFDNNTAGLLDGETASGVVTLAWTDGDSASGSVQVPVSATATVIYSWDGGAPNAAFYNAPNWDADVAPVSGISKVLFDKNISAKQAYLDGGNEFTVGAGQWMKSIGSYTLRIGSADLTLKSGGTIDFRTDGTAEFAQANNNPVQVTIEPNATFKVGRTYWQPSWTTTFVATNTGVTMMEVANWNGNGTNGNLVVDLQNYDEASGSVLILIDYDSGNTPFFNASVTNWSAGATFDFDYDYAGGKAVALIVEVDPFVSWAEIYGLTASDPDDINNAEGIDNLTCYGWGLNPNTGVADDGALPELGSDASGLVYVVAQRNDDPSLNFNLLTRDGLQFGDWNTNNTPVDYSVSGTLTVGEFDYVTNLINTANDVKFMLPQVTR